MDVRSLCGGCENVCQNYMQPYCTCFCVGLEREGNSLLPWRRVIWYFFGIFCGHLFRFFPESLSLPHASCIVYVLLLGVTTPGGDVLGLIWYVS